MATLASALVALSQGVVFFHAGDEILRSKSLDRDSYSSGTRYPPTSQQQKMRTACDGLADSTILLGRLFEPSLVPPSQSTSHIHAPESYQKDRIHSEV